MSKNILVAAHSLFEWGFAVGLIVLALVLCVYGADGFVRCIAGRNYIGIVVCIIFFC